MSVQKVYRPQFLMEPAEGPGAGGSGGAAKFIELTDGPGSINPGAILVGNEAGTALEFLSPKFNSNLYNTIQMAAINYYQGDDIIASMNNGGLSRVVSVDGGMTWTQTEAVGDIFQCVKFGTLFKSRSSSVLRTTNFSAPHIQWTTVGSVGSRKAELVTFVGDVLVVFAYEGGAAPKSTVYINEDPLNTTGLTSTFAVSKSFLTSAASRCAFSDTTIAMHQYDTGELHVSNDQGRTFITRDVSNLFGTLTASLSIDDDHIVAYSNTDKVWYESFDLGATWAELVLPFECHNIHVYKNLYIAVPFMYVRNSVYWFSTDGINWSPGSFLLYSPTASPTAQKSYKFYKDSFCTCANNYTQYQYQWEIGRFTPSLSFSPPSDGVLRGVQNNIWTPVNAPKSIEPGKILVGNADGTGFEWKTFSELAGE